LISKSGVSTIERTSVAPDCAIHDNMHPLISKKSLRSSTKLTRISNDEHEFEYVHECEFALFANLIE